MSQKTKIIPFNWELYQANKDKCIVITSHELPYKVTQLTKFEAEEDEFCLVGVFNGHIESWTLKGDFLEESKESVSKLQLLFTEEVVEGYANLYRYKPTGHYVISVAFNTKQTAEEYIVVNDETHDFIATIALHEIEKQTNK